MKILVTGANGFIGKNLVVTLKNLANITILECDKDTPYSQLEEYCQLAEFVYHLAGVNRPDNQSEFMEGNYEFTSNLLDLLMKFNNPCPVLITSSIQATFNNPYGKSKKAAEDLLFHYSRIAKTTVFIYRLPNVFGKWSRPNYNSVIATFCYNVARDLPLIINDPTVIMNMVYIDDVMDDFVKLLGVQENKKNDYCEVTPVYTHTLGTIAVLIRSFKEIREENSIPDMADGFTKKLFSTYLSYLPEDTFSYDLKMNLDDRGSFTEFIKSVSLGQIAVNITKPGITKGNHWHQTKTEKFLVVSGTGVIRFRKINTNEVIEYYVSQEKLQVVDIPSGYTHNIENLGDVEMVTIMWANEIYDIDKPDTNYLEV